VRRAAHAIVGHGGGIADARCLEALPARSELRESVDMDVVVEHRHAPAAELHGPIDASAEVSVVVMHPHRPALVLGSAQRGWVRPRQVEWPAEVDLVQRSSGGGAVFVDATQSVWIDLVVSRAADVLPDDVVSSMVLAGQWWANALCACGAEGLVVHDAPLVPGRVPEVCFSGRGPGEVMLGDRKLVGLSQRRTRSTVRIQGQFHVGDPTDVTHRLLGLAAPIDRDRPACWSLSGVNAPLLAGQVADALRRVIASA